MMRRETRANGRDEEATITRQIRVFYVADDEPQTRRETRANGRDQEASSVKLIFPASQAPSISKNNYESVESQAVGGK
ncbi:uncharacterized protein LOC144037047 isoform X3 [Vanacampus margaritifer]